MLGCVGCVGLGLLLAAYSQTCRGGDLRLNGLGLVLAVGGMVVMLILRQRQKSNGIGR
jgi:hypothetical protein